MKYKPAQNITHLYIPCAELEERGGEVLDTPTPFKNIKLIINFTKLNALH